MTYTGEYILHELGQKIVNEYLFDNILIFEQNKNRVNEVTPIDRIFFDDFNQLDEETKALFIKNISVELSVILFSLINEFSRCKALKIVVPDGNEEKNIVDQIENVRDIESVLWGEEGLLKKYSIFLSSNPEISDTILQVPE